MQLYPTSHDPTREAILVCRDAPWKVSLIAVFFWGFYALLAFVADGCPIWIQRLWATICVLVTCIAFRDWRLKRRPDSWMLALNRTGLWLNLRHIASHDGPSGETIVFLPYREIDWARRYTHKYRDAKQTRTTDEYLELMTTPGNSLDIEIALEDARKQGRVGGHVRAPEEGRLRIAVGTAYYGMQPPVWTVLERLGEFVPIAAPVVRQDTDELKLSDEQYDARAAELAAAGEKMAAVRLLTRRGGLSMTDAVTRYEELVEAAASARRQRLSRPPST